MYVMKKNIIKIAIFLFAVSLSSCNGNNNGNNSQPANGTSDTLSTEANVNTEVEPTTDTREEEPAKEVQTNNANTYYAWDLHLGKNIHVRLELEKNDEGMVAGEATYFKKNGNVADIPVYGKFGEIDGTKTLQLDEFDKTKVCGSYYIELNDDNSINNGYWALNAQKYDMQEMEKQEFSFGKHETFFFPMTEENLNAEYSFYYEVNNPNMPEMGGTTTLKTQDGKLKYSISKVSPNIAEDEGETVIQGNAFNGSIANYSYKVVLFRDFLYVIRTNPEEGPCEEFGAFSNLEGFYIKK